MCFLRHRQHRDRTAPKACTGLTQRSPELKAKPIYLLYLLLNAEVMFLFEGNNCCFLRGPKARSKPCAVPLQFCPGGAGQLFHAPYPRLQPPASPYGAFNACGASAEKPPRCEGASVENFCGELHVPCGE